MKYIINLLLITIFFLAKSQSQTPIAGNKVIEIDTLTELIKESPFDEKFTFKITKPTETKVYAYTIEELKRNEELKAEVWKEHKKKFPIYWP